MSEPTSAEAKADGHVTVSSDAGVTVVRITRPEKKNALTRAMYKALADALEEADAAAGIRCVVITGTADSFTAGNDLHDFLQAKPGEVSGAEPFLRALPSFSKPLIAAVNGLAVGIGVTMLLHCDLVYAAETAAFQVPFASLGVVPEAGSSLLLPRLVGHLRASELLLLGDFFDAAKARDFGLVNGVVTAAELEAAALAAAAKIAAKPPGAIRETKALLKSTATSTVVERIAQEGAIFAQRLHSPETREAMSAVMEKRKPDFSRFA